MLSFCDPNLQISHPIPSSVPRWFAVYTAPCREKRVLEHLVVREVESFLPLYRSTRRWRNGCRPELERALFPGYLFVRVARFERARVLSVPGVVSLVSSRVPEPLDDEVILALRANCYLHHTQPHAYLVAGERVSICRGPFSGLSGIVQRKKGQLRVVLSLSLIMQGVGVEVSVEDLEPDPCSYGSRYVLQSIDGAGRKMHGRTPS